MPRVEQESSRRRLNVDSYDIESLQNLRTSLRGEEKTNRSKAKKIRSVVKHLGKAMAGIEMLGGLQSLQQSSSSISFGEDDGFTQCNHEEEGIVLGGREEEKSSIIRAEVVEIGVVEDVNTEEKRLVLDRRLLTEDVKK